MSMPWDIFLDTVPRSPRCPRCHAYIPGWKWVQVEGSWWALTHDGDEVCPATSIFGGPACPEPDTTAVAPVLALVRAARGVAA